MQTYEHKYFQAKAVNSNIIYGKQKKDFFVMHFII